MKTIFTLLLSTASILFPGNEVISQCNYSSGGNGISTALPAAITIDGNMTDWAPYLNDPDNNSYDNTGGTDLDAPIADAGRDLVRFTFTENANNLFIFLERVGSENNSVDIIFYADINNNDFMDLKEPVIQVNWSGANGIALVHVHNYIPSTTSLLNKISANLDGSALWGTLLYRNSVGQTGKGSADGKSVEVRIPFAELTQLGASGNVINQLNFGQNFKFHVSTINGNVSSIPNSNSINDNFGGCLTAPVFVLPVKLISFSAVLANNKVDLKWATASEINVSHFVVERSTDGANYTDAGVVFAYGNATDKTNYNFSDNVSTIQSGVVYYRLRSVDIDGKVQYSETRIIRINKGKENTITIQTFPNPVTNELRITIPAAWQNKKVIFDLFNVTGQGSKKIETANSSQTETVNTSNLAPGLYIVKVSCEGQSIHQKIIKQ